MQDLNTPASLIKSADWVESYTVANWEDIFSDDRAHLIVSGSCLSSLGLSFTPV